MRRFITRINEKWKYITSDYMISNHGRILSVETQVECACGIRTKPEKLLAIRHSKVNPHLFTEIRIDKKSKTVYLHKLVAQFFKKPPREGYTMVTHRDGDYTNNHVSNLKWITPSEMISNQPKRLKDPTKSWRTRRKKYGKSGHR